MIDKHKFKQKCNNFGYLSIQFWLKGNNNSHIEHCSCWTKPKLDSNSEPWPQSEDYKWRSRPLSYGYRIQSINIITIFFTEKCFVHILIWSRSLGAEVRFLLTNNPTGPQEVKHFLLNFFFFFFFFNPSWNLVQCGEWL